MKGHFDKNRLYAARELFADLARSGVADIALGERQSGQKADIKIIADFQVRHDTEVKTRTGNRFGAKKKSRCQ